MTPDISKHKWGDDAIYEAKRIGDLIVLTCPDVYVSFNESDAIAIARSFGLIKCNHEFPRQGLQECIKCGEPILGGRLFNNKKD